MEIQEQEHSFICGTGREDDKVMLTVGPEDQIPSNRPLISQSYGGDTICRALTINGKFGGYAPRLQDSW